MKKSAKLDPLAERPGLDFSKGVRGKYTNLLQEGTNLVILEPSLMPYFPDSESVNRALHAFLDIGNSIQSAAPPRRRPKAARPPTFDSRAGTSERVANSR
ncbi:MAG: hypothetical protein ABI147_02600 [Acidobacteriaceae bacterium]